MSKGKSCAILKALKTDEQRKEFAAMLWADYQILGSVKRVGEKHGVNHASVHRYLKIYGYKLKGEKFTSEDDEVIKDYYNNTPVEIFDLDVLTEKLGRTAKTNVSRRARELGLTVQGREHNAKTRKKMSESTKEWHKNNEHPRGYLGHKHGGETRKKLSDRAKEYFSNEPIENQSGRVIKMLKTKHKKGNLHIPRKNVSWISQWAEIGGKRNFYRSRWELNYALYLQWLKENNQIIDWEHEPETFWFEGIMRGTRSYLPDFKVIELNGDVVYHEVKGWMDDRSKTKIKRMAKYHPNVKLIVIDAKAYKALAKTAKKFVKGWR